MKDLVILVPCLGIEQALNGLLNNPIRLGINNISFKIIRHPYRDSGVRKDAHHFLRMYYTQYKYTFVIFDKHGCGKESISKNEIENNVRENLFKNGWKDRADVVVIEPELENWVWSSSPEVDKCLGWSNHKPTLRIWLKNNNFWKENELKPHNPKTAFEKALKEVKKPISDSIFKELAEKVNFKECSDESFNKLLNILQKWFPLN